MPAKKELKPKLSNQMITSNTTTVYKYNPEDFIGIMNLSEDLAGFYNHHENYQKDNILSYVNNPHLKIRA